MLVKSAAIRTARECMQCDNLSHYYVVRTTRGYLAAKHRPLYAQLVYRVYADGPIERVQTIPAPA